MNRSIVQRAAAMVLAGAAIAHVMAADITITTSQQYQTIEGFGAFASIAPWKIKSGVFWVDVDLNAVGFYDSLVTELGATMWRTNVPSDGFEPSAGSFNRNDGGVRGWVSTINQLKAAAGRNGEPLRFISSCWSPPGWMKDGGIAACLVEGAPALNATTCKLSVGMEDDLGRHFAEWVDVIKDGTGIDLYALSIQNEAAFSEPYESCVYDGPRYTAVLKTVAPIVRAVAPDIKFFGAEHMSFAFPNTFENSIRADATARSYMHAWAVHGYTNGVQTDTGAYSGSTPTDKVFWMTETSGGGYGSGVNDWPGAMTLGRNILSYLKGGKMAAWTWWSLQDVVSDPATDPGNYCLVISGSKTAKYYVSSHFYRFVRPGARQVGSASNDGQVEVVAFRHPTTNCVTIVLINTAGVDKTVNVTGAGVTSFEMHVSTSASKRVKTTSVGTTGITVPASSVVTLVNGQYSRTEPISATRPVVDAAGLARQGMRRASVSVFTLDGREVSPAQVNAMRAGTMLVQRITLVNGTVRNAIVRAGR